MWSDILGQTGYPGAVVSKIAKVRFPGSYWKEAEEKRRLFPIAERIYEVYSFLIKEGFKPFKLGTPEQVKIVSELVSRTGFEKKDILSIMIEIENQVQAGNIDFKYLQPETAKKATVEKVKKIVESFVDSAEPAGKAVNSTINKILITAGLGLGAVMLLRYSQTEKRIV